MAIGTAALGAGTGLAKFFEGANMQREAQEFIDNFEWQDLSNPYENQQISTKSADLQKEQANLMSATAVDALQGGGTRALVGGLGGVISQNNTLNRQIGADLDKQQKELNYAISAQNVKNQDTIERRQSDELQGYGQQLYAGMNLKQQGFGNIIGAGGLLAQTQSGESIDKSIMKLFK